MKDYLNLSQYLLHKDEKYLIQYAFLQKLSPEHYQQGLKIIDETSLKELV